MAENYIKTLGTHFDLSFAPQPGYKFVLDFSIDKVDDVTGAGTKGIMGMYDSWPNRDSYLFAFEPGRRTLVSYAGGNYNLNCSQYVLGERMHLEYSDRGIVRDGVTYSVNSQYQAPQRNLWLGTVHSNSTEFTRQNNYYTWYSVKVYDGDNIILDLIPYKSNGFGCLKDAITGTIYEANDPTKVEFFGSVEGIEVSETSFNGGYSTSGTISVITAGEDDEWHITIEGNQFILLNYNTGRGSAEVPFFVFPNSRTDERTTTIVYTCGDYVQYVEITQTGNLVRLNKALKHGATDVNNNGFLLHSRPIKKAYNSYLPVFQNYYYEKSEPRKCKYAFTPELRVNGNDIVYTGIHAADNTKMRITGKGEGFTQGGTVLGYLAGESGKSFRIIRDNNRWYWDLNSSRLTSQSLNIAHRSYPFDITVGDNYLTGTSGTGTTATNINLTGTTQGQVLSHNEIYFTIGWTKVSSVEIWQNDVLVYNGYPTVGGWYDSISGTLTTHTENGLPIIVTE